MSSTDARAALTTASEGLTGSRSESLAAAAFVLDGGTPPRPVIVVLAPLTASAEGSAVDRTAQLRSAAAKATGRPESTIELHGPGQATVAVMRSVLARLSRGSRPAVVVFAGSATTTGGLRYTLSDGTLSAREVTGITKGAGHVSCATKCLAQGMPMGILTSNGTLYLVTLDHDNADPYNDLKGLAGKDVTVTGEMLTRSGMKAITATSVLASK